MKFCSRCGSPLTLRVPYGDDRERHVCDECNTIHYQNPQIVAGSLIVYGEKVLLCRRAIEPRYGYWTLPAGFMENGESTEQCAERESWEEAQAQINIHGLYTMFSLPNINQVYLLFRADLSEATFSTGPESLEVGLFSEEEIPWDELAFPVMDITLKHYFSDRQTGNFPIHSETILTPPINRKS